VSGIYCNRMRPMPSPAASAATAIKALVMVWRPRTPDSSPPPIGLVHFDHSLQAPASGSHHRPAQLVQQRPSVLVAAQTQHPLQPQGANTIFLGSHLPHRPKPNRQRQFAVLKDRARRDRGLPTAVFTTPKMASDRRPLATTGGTNNTFGPPQGKQIGTATCVVTEPPFQFQ
jgi:hypothetical protein